eukprot:scaffold80375_cov26-Tisochrysis_lutea.AAC.1
MPLAHINCEYLLRFKATVTKLTHANELIREESKASVKVIRSELTAVGSEVSDIRDTLNEESRKESRDSKGRETELMRKVTSIMGEADEALDTLSRQLRQLAEDGETLREAQTALSKRVTQTEEIQEETMRRFEEHERLIQGVSAQGREQRDSLRVFRTASHAGLKEVQASITRIEREMRSPHPFGGGNIVDAANVASGPINLPRASSTTGVGSPSGIPIPERRDTPQPALVRRFSDASVSMIASSSPFRKQ